MWPLLLLKVSAFLLSFDGEATAQSRASAPTLEPKTILVKTLEREYLLALPRNVKPASPTGDQLQNVQVAESSTTSAHPVVFVWHGHGGGMRHSARTFRIHDYWPEAIVVYPQGLPTPGMTDPEGKKGGWQRFEGDQNNRDLHFFDSLLEQLSKTYAVDRRRLYSMGHSNGGAFTYLLAMARPGVLAAIAPSAAPARGVRARFLTGDPLANVPPLPVMHVVGNGDKIVPRSWQLPTIEAFKKHNQCVAEGKAWEMGCWMYESKLNAPLIVMEHNGGHTYPQEANEKIVHFFKSHPPLGRDGKEER
jgi:polyhydroxybutyrate depolymerase